MSRTAPESAAPPSAPSAAAIAVAGLVVLAVAMGIGRFAFTPILPMMLHDGVVDLAAASWLASANYIGYLAGAVLCTLLPFAGRRVPRLSAIGATTFVRGGLIATAALTLAMVLPWPGAWPLLRFAAGVASAVVLIYSSGWCLGQLAARGRPALGGVMFAGPGAGIVASGLVASALVAWHAHAVMAWAVFAALAIGLTSAVWRIFRREDTVAAVAAATAERVATVAPARASATEVGFLAVAYGIAGFGYIVTATFLPVIARAALPGSPWLDLFWPVFGAGIVAGALLSSRLRISSDLRLLLAAAYVLQAAGIGVGLQWPTLAGFALGSVMLGFPFTTITFFVLQEARQLRPATAASTIGLVTAIYGIGQIVGPMMVARLLLHSATPHGAFTLALVIAASALLCGAALYLAMWRLWPKRP